MQQEVTRAHKADRWSLDGVVLHTEVIGDIVVVVYVVQQIFNEVLHHTEMVTTMYICVLYCAHRRA